MLNKETLKCYIYTKLLHLYTLTAITGYLINIFPSIMLFKVPYVWQSMKCIFEDAFTRSLIEVLRMQIKQLIHVNTHEQNYQSEFSKCSVLLFISYKFVKSFLAITFYYFLYLAETYMICIKDVHVVRNEFLV